MPENVQELLEHAEEAARAGDLRTSGILVNAVLKVDIRNTRAWTILHEQYGNGKPFAEFQHDFASRYYPQEAALLDEIPAEPAETAAELPPAANELAENAEPLQQTVIDHVAEQDTFTPAAQAAAIPTNLTEDLGEGEKIICPHCNGLNEPLNTYCLFCGGRLVMNNFTPPPAAEILEEERRAKAQSAADAVPTAQVSPFTPIPEALKHGNTDFMDSIPQAQPSWIRIYGPWFLWTAGWIPFWLLFQAELAPWVLLNVALEALASVTGLTLVRSSSTFARRSGWAIAILGLVSVLIQAVLVIRAYVPGIIPF